MSAASADSVIPPFGTSESGRLVNDMTIPLATTPWPLRRSL